MKGVHHGSQNSVHETGSDEAEFSKRTNFKSLYSISNMEANCADVFIYCCSEMCSD